MNTPRVLRSFALQLARRLAALLLLASIANATIAQQTDPPGRVAYLNDRQGTLSVSPSGDDSWYESVPNRPFTQGDRLWTDRGGRAELYVGDTAIRMDEQTQLEITELGDQSLRLTLQQGRVQLRLRGDSGEPQRVELGTGNLAVVMRGAGDYRVLADPPSDSTQVMVAQGSATVFGENGQSQEIGNRQQAVYTGRDLITGGAPQALPADFERWLAERDQVEEQSQSARYISREIPGYQQLDQHGQWQSDPTYGPVWYPSDVASDWAPYSDGYWSVVAPYGYTWIDRAPWGFAPFHYGRWTRIGPRWCWVPGPRHARPVYSPALVAFVGGAGSQLAVRGGRPAVGWFPLAPGERWQPPYRTTARYVDRANRAITGVPPLAGRPDYANRSLPHAVTAVPVDRFGHGGPMGRRDFVRPPAPALAAAPGSQRPPVPAAPAASTGQDRRADGGFPGRRTHAAPPPAVAALAPQTFDRFQGNPGDRRQRPPDMPPRPPQLGQPGIAVPQQQQQQQQQVIDAQRRSQQFAQQEQMRQQRQQAERFEQERQQMQQQQDNQRRIRQAQQDQERQQRDVMIQHNQVQQQQALQRQQTERAQRELQMQQAQQQGAMHEHAQQQQRQQQIERQQRQQQMDLQQRQQREMQQQQQQQLQHQQQMARQQQEAQMRAQQQQQQQQAQRERERQQPGGPNRMRGVPGITDNQQR